jgi:hypothetical protein
MSVKREQRYEISKQRLAEATAVRQAYDVQVVRLRGLWRSAAPDAAAKAERKLRLALEQQKAAAGAEDLLRVECYG